MKIKSCLVLLTLFFGQYCIAADLSKAEAQIAKRISSNLPESIKLLEEIVNINSGTMNFEGVRAVGQRLKVEFEQVGFDTQWVNGDSFDRAGHLIASHSAQQPNKPKILLIGHLDTVFAKDDEFQKYNKIDDRYSAGPGVTDMKGGNLIILNAVRALKEMNLLDAINIKVVMTGDEERSGRPLADSKKAITDAAQWADIALGFEDGDSDIKTAVIARRGSVSWQLDVVGKPAHSSQIFKPEVGYGAVFEMARILNEFRVQLAGVGELSFNPGLILGGTSIEHDKTSSSGDAFGKGNVIAKTAMATGGIRALTPDELANAKAVMQDIASQNLAQTSATLSFDEGYPPMAPTQKNKQLLRIYSEVSEALGYGPVIAVNPRNAGAADISFTSGLVDMALDGLGLMGAGGHTRDEIADMSSFEKNSQKAAILLHRLSAQ
jgi:glutamate carboxypeptidase